MHFWHTIAADNDNENDTDNDNENDTDNVNENDIENENDIYIIYLFLFFWVVIIFEKEILYPVCG